jgi:hypothetical protein
MAVIVQTISVFWTGVSRPVAALQTKLGIQFSFEFNATPGPKALVGTILAYARIEDGGICRYFQYESQHEGGWQP